MTVVTAHQHKRQQGKTPRRDTLTRTATKMAPASPGESEGSSTLDAEDSSPGDSPASTPAQEGTVDHTQHSEVLLQKFQVIFQKPLDSTSKQIMDRLPRDLKELGQHITQLEGRTTATIMVLEGNEKDIDA